METITRPFSYQCYEQGEALPAEDAALLREARQATRQAYAPYSHFQVGAAVRLSNGVTVTGANQENASFPAGICAERSVLATAASAYPGVPVAALAVSFDHKERKSDHPISPCGICRQSLLEYEQRYRNPIRIILGGLEGKVYVIGSVSVLLPLSFSADDLGA